MIEKLRQEANAFNRWAFAFLRVLVGLSCVMYAVFHLFPAPLIVFLVSSHSIIVRTTHFLQSFLRKNPYLPPLCVSYLARLRFSYTTFSRLFCQASFVPISIHSATIHQYPIDSSTRSLYWPRPYLFILKYHGRLPFGGHTHLS